MGLKLGLGKSLFPVGRAKDQRLPAGPIATAFNIRHYSYFSTRFLLLLAIFFLTELINVCDTAHNTDTLNISHHIKQLHCSRNLVLTYNTYC